jgi:hypothetical protein
MSGGTSQQRAFEWMGRGAGTERRHATMPVAEKMKRERDIMSVSNLPPIIREKRGCHFSQGYRG